MSKTLACSDQEAERELARMLLDIGRMPTAKGLTLERYVEDMYKPYLEQRVRKSTRIGYTKKLNLYVLPKLGTVRLADLEPYVLDRWRDDLMGRMSGQSALHAFRVLSVALNRAVKWRLIPSNPLLAVDPPRAKVRDLDTLTADEALAYLKAFDGHELAPIVITAIASGLRPCELAALTWADIDLAGGTVQVSRGLHESKGVTWFEDPKSDRSRRTVSLPAWAVTALQPLRGIGPLVPDGSGHMQPTKIARRYMRKAQAEKLRYVPLRDLRHTHATLMLQAGVDVVVVSRRLGHSTIAITDKHYLKPKMTADQAAADAFGNLLATAGDNSRKAAAGDTTKADNG